MLFIIKSAGVRILKQTTLIHASKKGRKHHKLIIKTQHIVLLHYSAIY